VGNNVSNNKFGGVDFKGDATDNILTGNIVRYNGFEGIKFNGNAAANLVAGNDVSKNGFGGIDFKESSIYNVISGNDVINNAFKGIQLSNISFNNILNRNNLSGNLGSSAYDSGKSNHWDNGAVGNYYSDFDCEDRDGNSICDSPCNILGGSNVDRYPLASPISIFEPPENRTFWVTKTLGIYWAATSSGYL
jgi:parallel beta-helix repeat protein